MYIPLHVSHQSKYNITNATLKTDEIGRQWKSSINMMFVVRREQTALRIAVQFLRVGQMKLRPEIKLESK